MKTYMLLAVIILLITSACSQSDTKEPEFFGSNFSISSCLRYVGDGAGLEKFLKTQMKINELTPKTAQNFLNNNNGKAWSMTSPDGSYAVTYRDDGICTVFIKRANVSKFIKHMNKNIKRISKKTDWEFSTDNIPMFADKNKLKSYELSVKISEKIAKVVISATTKTTGNYQVAFSTSLK